MFDHLNLHELRIMMQDALKHPGSQDKKFMKDLAEEIAKREKNDRQS